MTVSSSPSRIEDVDLTSSWYVYVDYAADTLVPFYVGKGTSNRLYQRLRNTRHNNFQKKHGIIRQTFFESDDEKLTLDYETVLIAKLHTFVDDPCYNGVGCNYTTGGEGYAHARETKKRMSLSAKKRWEDPLERKRAREKSRIAQNERMKDPKIREISTNNLIQATIARWEDPEAHVKLSKKLEDSWKDPVRRSSTIRSFVKSWEDLERLRASHFYKENFRKIPFVEMDDVLVQIGQGVSTRQIAERYGTYPENVRGYVKRWPKQREFWLERERERREQRECSDERG